MRIGEASQTVGVSAATLRMWERQGLIRPGRTAGGDRVFSEENLALLRRIRYMREVERLNLVAIARLLAEGARPSVAGQPTDNSVPHSGDRLRAKRHAAGLTLKQVAESTRLSVAYISAVERGVTNPSISALQRLSSFYGLTVLDFMGNVESPMRLVRKTERPRFLGSGSGVTIEQLALGTLQMEPQLFSVQPGAGSEGAYDHVGEEFIFVLSGALDIWLDEQEHYALQVGDCLYFPSMTPHRWRNPGPGEAQLLWVNTPPTF